MRRLSNGRLDRLEILFWVFQIMCAGLIVAAVVVGVAS